MEKKKNSQTIIIAILAVAVLFMSIGFAAFAQRLNIQGDVEVSAAKWSIHWDTESYQKAAGSVDIVNMSREAGTQPELTNTDISFGAKLTKPGDTAEFSIDAVNDGTFDAELTAITLSTLTEAQQKYLEYSVKYAGTTYTQSATGLHVSLPASGSNTATVIVKVKYVQPTNSADLPSATDVQNPIRFTASFDYSQVES